MQVTRPFSASVCHVVCTRCFLVVVLSSHNFNIYFHEILNCHPEISTSVVFTKRFHGSSTNLNISNCYVAFSRCFREISTCHLRSLGGAVVKLLAL